MTLLPLRVPDVQSRKEGVVEEDLLGLNPLDFVFDPVLLPIPRIPFTFDYFWYERQGRSELCILIIYTYFRLCQLLFYHQAVDSDFGYSTIS